LVENHPKRAGGSEAIRTSYAVGLQYQEALQDYFETKENVRSDIIVDVIEKNTTTDSNLLNVFHEKTNKEIIDKKKYQEILHTQISEAMWNLFQMYSSNNKNNFVDSLNIGENIIPEFFSNLYESYLQTCRITHPEIKDLTLFLNYLIKNELLPFSKQDLQQYLRQTKEISFDSSNIEKRAIELYDIISEFLGKLNNFQIN